MQPVRAHATSRAAHALQPYPPPTLQRIIEDCKSVFGKGGGSEKTWWIACDGKARCALEQLALAVFKVKHNRCMAISILHLCSHI